MMLIHGGFAMNYGPYTRRGGAAPGITLYCDYDIGKVLDDAKSRYLEIREQYLLLCGYVVVVISMADTGSQAESVVPSPV